MPILAILLLALASGPAPVQEVPPEDVIIYRSDTNDRAFAFSPRGHDFKSFYGPYRSSIWQGDIGGFFQVQEKDGIRYEEFTGVSLPNDLEKTKTWQVKGYKCESEKVSGDRWWVRCSGAANQTYIYRKGIGIIGLTFPCTEIKVCWFDLKTKIGILSGQ